MVRKFRAFCLRESVRDCRRLCASCNWKWASARYASGSPPPPHFPLLTNRLCQICAAVVFFSHSGVLFASLRTFFFISKVCSHCAALSRLRQLFSVQPMCLVGKWDEEGERERAKWERLSHMCWYAHARSTQKNIGNPTHTYTTFYTSTHTHTHVYTLLSLKIKFILKYVENSILEWALLHYIYSQCCCASIITVHQLALGTTSNREWKKTRPLLQIGRYFRIAYIVTYVCGSRGLPCLPAWANRRMCVLVCVVWGWTEYRDFFRGGRERGGGLGQSMIWDRAEGLVEVASHCTHLQLWPLSLCCPWT